MSVDNGRGLEATGTDQARRVTRKHLAFLCAILAVGFALRATALVNARSSPGYSWEDPDGYLSQALRLAGPDGWSWTFAAVTYSINGQRHALPPLYSVFLSGFALWPHFPLTAQVAQVVLAVVSIALVFALGRIVHSTRAGLVAAAIYAVWVPNIFNVWSTSQETVYLPLMLAAFLLLASAIDRDGRARWFVAAGLTFGLAALTRSMPLFFAMPVAIFHVLMAHDRRRATQQASAFLAGFLLVTVPYSAALSEYFGQLTIIDTHGSIHLDSATGSRAPGLLETARSLWNEMSAKPGEFFSACLARARSLLYVNGGRILQIYVVADTKVTAATWKILVHLGSDALLIFGATFAALGAALCRRPKIAVVFLLWTFLNIAIASVGGFGGARLRAPFEPLLVILAAVVVSGQWRRPHPIAVGAALVTGAVAAAAVLPQIPNSLRAWPDYGVSWPSVFTREVGQFRRAAGLNAPAFDGIATLSATPSGDRPVTLEVRIGGIHVRSMEVAAGETGLIRTQWPRRGLAFIELAALGADAQGTTIEVRVPGR